jgi:hypothetical protein
MRTARSTCQASSAGKDKDANWLPLPPSGMVNLSIRIYNPKSEALDPSYKFPPVKRVDQVISSRTADQFSQRDDW